MSDWPTIKGRSRRIVHDAFKAPAQYSDSVVTTPQDIGVRLHNVDMAVSTGQGAEVGLVDLVRAQERAIFDDAELAAFDPPVVPRVGGVLVFPGYGGITYRLSTREDDDTPGFTIWYIARTKAAP